METVYEKYRPAHEILIEYYAYCELRGFLQDDWEKEDKMYKAQCDKLYEEYKTAAAREKDREENSKSARIDNKKVQNWQSKFEYINHAVLNS